MNGDIIHRKNHILPQPPLPSLLLLEVGSCWTTFPALIPSWSRFTSISTSPEVILPTFFTIVSILLSCAVFSKWLILRFSMTRQSCFISFSLRRFSFLASLSTSL